MSPPSRDPLSVERARRWLQRWWAVGAALGIFLAMQWSGLMEVLEQHWRAQTIGWARRVAPRPLPKPPADAEVPLCILFAIYRENAALPRMPEPARWSPDPEIRHQRLALLLGMMAGMPPEYRPRAVAVVLPLHETDAESDPYLAAALRRLGNVVLGAWQEPDERWRLRPLSPGPLLAGAATEVALADFPLPLLATEGGAPRLYAWGTRRGSSDGNPPLRGLGAALAVRAAPGRQIDAVARPRIPIPYWNLYSPDEGAGQDLGAWVAKWPHVGADRFLLRAIPWEPGEDPDDWLERLAQRLVAGDRQVFDTLADDLGPALGGRIVIIGEGFPGATVPTPFTARAYRHHQRQRGERPRTPIAVLHAATTAGLLRGEIPRDLRVSGPIGWSLVWGLIGAVGGAACRLGLRRARAVSLGFGVIGFLSVLAVVDIVLAGWLDVWLPTVRILSLFLLMLAAGLLVGRRREVEARQRLDETLRQVVPYSAQAKLEGESSGLADAARERRDVTAMAVDMAAFTPWFQALERARARALLPELHGEFFSRVVEVLDRHGAVLTDQTGDGFAACFEGGITRTQASRALAAALDILDVVEDWRRTSRARMDAAGLREVPLPGLRVGIAHGETVIGLVGSVRQRRPIYFGGAFIRARRVEQLLKAMAQGRAGVLVIGVESTLWHQLPEHDRGRFRVVRQRRESVKPGEEAIEVLELERA